MFIFDALKIELKRILSFLYCIVSGVIIQNWQGVAYGHRLDISRKVEMKKCISEQIHLSTSN